MKTFDASWTSISYPYVSEGSAADEDSMTYHLKAIQLLLNLLCQHRRQPIASSNLASSIIKVARISVMELDPWAKGDVSRCVTAWCSRSTLPIRASESCQGHEVIFTLDCNGIGSSMTRSWWLTISGSARCTRARGVGHGGEGGVKGTWRDVCIERASAVDSIDRSGGG